MKEYYLQMAWKHLLLAGRSLRTCHGEPIEILFQGYGPTSLGGPDFTMAKLRLNGATWLGSVEVHEKSSLWHAHGHSHDPKYENVILHVVWEHDREINLSNGEEIPCLQLKDYLSESWVEQIERRFAAAVLPCADMLSVVPSVVFQSQLDVTLSERLQRRVEEVDKLYQECSLDWDECLYRFTARFLGQKVNNECMVQVAAATPYKLILRHASSLLDLEALLFGQAGFLEEDLPDLYFAELKYRYTFFMHKYGLKQPYNIKNQWQYKGLRPLSFPELRLAQWAYLLHKKGRLMSWAVELPITDYLNEVMEVGDYWKIHHRFGMPSSENFLKSKQWHVNILINALIPFRIAYKNYTEQLPMDAMLHYYEDVPAENNRIVALYKTLGYPSVSARDTQGMLELYNNYCNYKKCLSCKVGHSILKREGLL